MWLRTRYSHAIFFLPNPVRAEAVLAQRCLSCLTKNKPFGNGRWRSSSRSFRMHAALERPWFLWSFHPRTRLRGTAKCWRTSMVCRALQCRCAQACRLTPLSGTASNIKSRVNRLSVLAAITSTQQKLKLYTRVPTNGLVHIFLLFFSLFKVIYCGTVLTEEGKEKKVNIDFEPHKPVNTSLYLCDSRFHTEVCTGPCELSCF